MFITDIKRVVEQVSRDKGIDSRILIQALEEALKSAARKKFGAKIDIEVKYNEETGEIEVFQFKEVVEKIAEPDLEIDLEQGYKLDPDCEIGDSLGTKMDTSTFGRIAAQSAKQVIIQKMKDAERDAVYTSFIDRKGEIINGIVQRIDRGDIIVNLGHTEGVLSVREQVPKESYRRGDRIRALIMDVLHDTRGPQIILSRTHPDFLVQLFKTEVPEISEGIVDIMGAVREPGVRAKFAVASNDTDIDPVGACVGMKGSRVQNVVQELRGEKIDIISWHVDAAKFVCNSLAPAEISRVIIDEEDRSMEVIVPDEFLSIAIGKRGQNVRLASKLTRWHLDVISESRYSQTMEDGYDSLVVLAGIGISLADALFEKGFYSAEELCNASVEDLTRIRGIGEEKALKLIEAAKKSVAESLELKAAPQEVVPDPPADDEAPSESDASDSSGAAGDEAPSESDASDSSGATDDEALSESDSSVSDDVSDDDDLPESEGATVSNVPESENDIPGDEEDASGTALPPDQEATDDV